MHTTYFVMLCFVHCITDQAVDAKRKIFIVDVAFKWTIFYNGKAVVSCSHALGGSIRKSGAKHQVDCMR